MNKANVLKLAEYIEGLEPGEYDQRYVDHPRGPNCGTPACIAGHAAYLAGRWECSDGIITAAREWLGLQRPDAESASVLLFDSHPFHPDETPTPQDAAVTLRHLAETGEVAWPHRREDPA